MATSRLRKAFRYPSEEDEDPSLMDEEQQDKLIEDLQQQDADKTTLYNNIFQGVPLSAALFFLHTFVLANTSRQRLIALLAISSLLCTSYALRFMPIRAPDKKGKKAVYRAEAEHTPVEKYLLSLNAALAGLLLISATASWRRDAREDAWREALPASMHPHLRSTLPLDRPAHCFEVVFALSMFVRQQLTPVDFEELQRARYELKGA